MVPVVSIGRHPIPGGLYEVFPIVKVRGHDHGLRILEIETAGAVLYLPFLHGWAFGAAIVSVHGYSGLAKITESHRNGVPAGTYLKGLPGKCLAQILHLAKVSGNGGLVSGEVFFVPQEGLALLVEVLIVFRLRRVASAKAAELQAQQFFPCIHGYCRMRIFLHHLLKVRLAAAFGVVHGLDVFQEGTLGIALAYALFKCAAVPPVT